MDSVVAISPEAKGVEICKSVAPIEDFEALAQVDMRKLACVSPSVDIEASEECEVYSFKFEYESGELEYEVCPVRVCGKNILIDTKGHGTLIAPIPEHMK